MLKQSSIELPQDGPRVGAAQSARGADARQARFRQRVLGLAALTLILVICYSRPLSHLAVFALQSELYDYNLLIPFVSLYLIWLKRNSLPLEVRPSWRWAALPLIVSLGMLGGYWLAVHNGWHPNRQNYLCLMIFSFLLSLVVSDPAFDNGLMRNVLVENLFLKPARRGEPFHLFATAATAK